MPSFRLFALVAFVLASTAAGAQQARTPYVGYLMDRSGFGAFDVSLQWSDIDWDRRVLKLMRQKKRGAKKTPKPHVIPITGRMMELILKQIDPGTGKLYHPAFVWTFVAERTYVNRKAHGGFYEEGKRYPITYNGLGTFWRRWKEEHGIENCRMHDMRHAAGTMLEDVAGDIAMPQQMLGHSDRATTERYIHRNVDKLRAAMEATRNALRLRGDDCRSDGEAASGEMGSGEAQSNAVN